MNPTRRYKRRAIDEMYGTPSEVMLSVEEGDDPRGLADARPDIGVQSRNEGVYAHIEPGGWNVADPKTGYYPKVDGERQLFSANPSVLSTLYGTEEATPKAVQQVLALSHQEAKKYGSGELTYADELSEFSSPLVLRALDKGYVTENPELPRAVLEGQAQDRADSREFDLTSSAEWQNAQAQGNRAHRRSLGRMTRDNMGRMLAYTEGVNRVTDLPENAGEEAVNNVVAARNRRVSKQELPEPEQAPLPDEGNLWDHAGRKDQNSWNKPMGLPARSRVDAFKDSLSGIVSRVRGK